VAKQFTSSEKLLDGLREDILWLLILIYAHRQRCALPSLATMSHEALALEVLLLESASRDIVTRLTALDDEGKGSRSFQSAFAAMKREGLDRRRTAALDKDVKAFRQSLNDLKVKHRNAYIAHVKELAQVTPRVLDEPVEFADCASRAVNLLDAMVGRTVTYVFKIGSTNQLDLRQELGSSSHEAQSATVAPS
jgi:hypothetical protein